MSKQTESLLSQMTIEEKVSLLAGADLWHTTPVERLGIPAIKVTDGPNGARGADRNLGPSSACFPVGVALAATWNPELVERVGAALGEETKSKGAHILLAPTVNIHRSPLAGRNFECYSEDPYLAGQMAVAYIRGLQSQGVGACIKHFVCNDSEFERFTMSSEVRERVLREIYLTPFRTAVREAKPWAVMSAYNKVNGVYCSENSYLLLDILKGEWGFDGIVISDWYGTYSDNAAAGGLDLEMPGPARWMGDNIVEAVKSGELDEAVIDDKVRRLLRTMEKAGAFQEPESRPEQAIDRLEHRRLARQAAGEAIVLLKNDNHILPLDPEKLTSIAVIGENARWAQIQGGGSAGVTPHYVVAPLDGIRNRVGDAIEVGYEIGCTVHRMLPHVNADWLTTADGRRGLRLEYFPNRELAGEPVHTQVTERTQFGWFGDTAPHIDPDNFSLRLTGSFTPPATGTYAFSLMSTGLSRLSIDGKVWIDHWTRRSAEAPAWDRAETVVEVQMTAGLAYPLEIEYAVERGTRWRTLRVGCMPPMPDDPIASAVALAERCDAAVVFAGLTNEWESEGFDRPDMELRGDQVELIERVAAANPNTIVVLNTGAPVRMDWLDRVPAVVQAWYTGQEAGNAIADVLFGDVNPSGKLPTTFPKRLQDNPAYINYPGENGQVHYGEGLFVGYRYYDKKGIEPLFPFGHGLSYTTFEYSNLTFSATESGPGDEVRVGVDVTNTGARAGKEVVQLYIRDVESSLVRPEKELKAFAKVSLAPGETQTVTFTLSEQALSFYDPARRRWVTEAGAFQVLIGSSARDIRLAGEFEWQGEPDPNLDKEARLHIGLPLRVLLEDKHARAVLEKHIPEILKAPEVTLAMGMTLEKIAEFVPQILTFEKLKAINEDLASSEQGR